MSEILFVLALLVVFGVLALVLDRSGGLEAAYGRKATWISSAAIAVGLVIYGLVSGTGDALLLAIAFMVAASYEHREWKRRRDEGRDGSAAELAG